MPNLGFFGGKVMGEPISRANASDFENGGKNDQLLRFLMEFPRVDQIRSSEVSKFKTQFPELANSLDEYLKFEEILSIAFQRIRKRKIEKIAQASGFRLVDILEEDKGIFTCLVMTHQFQNNSITFNGHQKIMRIGFGNYLFKKLKNEFFKLKKINLNFLAKPIGFGAAGKSAWVLYDKYKNFHPSPEANDFIGQVIDLFAELAQNFASLHDHGFCHNRFKPTSVCLDERFGKTLPVRIGDLQFLTREGVKIRRKRDRWDPPEMGKSLIAKKSADVYRLALVMAWFIDPEILARDFSPADRLCLIKDFPEPLNLILSQCLALQEADRIDSANELIRLISSLRK